MLEALPLSVHTTQGSMHCVSSIIDVGKLYDVTLNSYFIEAIYYT